jgi:hypothetical protein
VHRLLPVPLLTGVLLFGCTHDFDQFAPVAGSGNGTTTTTSGSGGAGTTTGTGGGATTTGTGGQGTGGAGTGGTATGGSGGQTGTGGQNTGGAQPDGGGVEDCANGKDDDGDGKADCADPKCDAGFTCAPTAPDTWSGPGWLYDGATAGAPSCGGATGDTQYEGHRDLVVAPALCGPCSCGDAKGSCDLAPITGYGTPACSGGDSSVGQGPPGQCRETPGNQAESYKANAPTLKSASCTPNKVVVSRPAAEWDTKGVVCGVAPSTAIGCVGGAVCAPRALAPFGAALCVWKAGDAQCPAAFPEKHSFYDGATDGRDCTACECGPASATCAAVTHVFANNCNQQEIAAVPNDGTCVAANNAGRMKVEVTVSGSCAASGGQPTGALTEGPSTTTVCCAK